MGVIINLNLTWQLAEIARLDFFAPALKISNKKTMIKKLIFFLFITLFAFSSLKSQDNAAGNSKMIKLENPVTTNYIKTKLKRTSPRLILTPAIEKNLKQKIKSDPIVKNYYQALKLNAAEILNQPLLTRTLVGRRLLATSREMLYRMTILSIVYRIEKDPKILNRINDELQAVCNFSDWHPAHFLDVAELSLAVAIAVDWTGMDLPKSTVALAKKSLIEKGIKPSYNENQSPSWVTATHNWNQVCNGGMIAAAIVTADIDPALSAKTISRALDGLPYALQQYGPDGCIPKALPIGATAPVFRLPLLLCCEVLLEPILELPATRLLLKAPISGC